MYMLKFCLANTVQRLHESHDQTVFGHKTRLTSLTENHRGVNYYGMWFTGFCQWFIGRLDVNVEMIVEVSQLWNVFESAKSWIFLAASRGRKSTRIITPITSPVWWSERDNRLLLWRRVLCCYEAVNKPQEQRRKGRKNTLRDKQATRGIFGRNRACWIWPTPSIILQELAALRLRVRLRRVGRAGQRLTVKDTMCESCQVHAEPLLESHSTHLWKSSGSDFSHPELLQYFFYSAWYHTALVGEDFHVPSLHLLSVPVQFPVKALSSCGELFGASSLTSNPPCSYCAFTSKIHQINAQIQLLHCNSYESTDCIC